MSTHTRRAVITVLVAVVAQAALVTLFVVPGHAPEPNEVPVAVAGPPAAAQQVQQRADAAQPGALDVIAVPDAAAARAAVLEREAYGALVPAQQTLYVASAASLPVAQLLRQALPADTVQDLRPLDPDDPRGATFNLLLLPLIVVALPVALVLSRLPTTGLGVAGVVLAFAALAGLAVTGVVHAWIGVLPGSYLALAGIAATVVAAVTLFATGLARRLGPPGVGLAALVVFLVGNPTSGAASAPELLPDGWRQVGELLPPSAGVTALRNTAYFDGAALGRPLLVLAVFAVIGLGLLLLAGARTAPAPAPAR